MNCICILLYIFCVNLRIVYSSNVHRLDWRQERKLNVETFGVSASNNWIRRNAWRGRGNWRGSRGGYGPRRSSGGHRGGRGMGYGMDRLSK